MKYLIDSANEQEIAVALELGFQGITANPVMYQKEDIDVLEFIRANKGKTKILTAEVQGNVEQMLVQVKTIVELDENIIIKLNYGAEELKLTKYLKQMQIDFAFTLIFDEIHASLAMQAGAKYLFYFIARSEELGSNPETILDNIRDIKERNNYDCMIVGASIRNSRHLKIAIKYADYGAVTNNLVTSSFQNEQVQIGRKQFNIE